ncbi:MAG: class I SAM-dependent methyltransferase [Actinobacteria bacterium]|jgi:ubiquinone/menaquinone biosynthesis C-methylase UbiE|nr:MAG: class I SAM-dependent methyltransferase [Actinomycetota bacterium]
MDQRSDAAIPLREKGEFDDWAGRYESGLLYNVFFRTLHRRFVRKIKPLPGAEYLDVGCGTGAVSRRLVRKGARVTGVDYSPGMLAVARSLSRDMENLAYIQGSADSLPCEEGRCDGVVTAFSFHHFPNAEGALREIRRVLRPGGSMFLCDATRNGMLSRGVLRIFHYFMARKGVHTHGEGDRYYTLGELKGLVEQAGFSEVKARLICILPWVAVVSGVRPGATKGEDNGQ